MGVLIWPYRAGKQIQAVKIMWVFPSGTTTHDSLVLRLTDAVCAGFPLLGHTVTGEG